MSRLEPEMLQVQPSPLSEPGLSMPDWPMYTPDRNSSSTWGNPMSGVNPATTWEVFTQSRVIRLKMLTAFVAGEETRHLHSLSGLLPQHGFKNVQKFLIFSQNLK